MKIDYQKLTVPNEAKAIAMLQDWIRIDSVFDEKTVAPGKPFGEGVYQALRYVGALAEKEGFKVDYCDGYATEISYGEGPIIGVYSHADVVPVSGAWTYPPFSATIADGKMFGRGTSDDKGPGMAAFYALVALKNAGLIKGFQVRHVIGGNEERGSRCLDYYFHQLHRPYPKYGFTPDAEFPLIYGEKGISNYQTHGLVDLGPVVAIDAGVVANSVIDTALAEVRALGPIETILKQKGYAYRLGTAHDHPTVTLLGKAAHGSVPEFGINAGIRLLEVLGEAYDLSLLSKIAALYSDPSGKTLGEFAESPLLHATTYNVGLIRYDGHEFSFVVNFRYPETVDPNQVIGRIADKLPLSTKVLGSSRSLFFDPQSPMVQTLLKVYQTETGDYETPMMTIGGGTYAKEAEHTVAFGSAFPGSNDHIHEPDERIELAHFTKSMPIYAHAIHALGKLK